MHIYPGRFTHFPINQDIDLCEATLWDSQVRIRTRQDDGSPQAIGYVLRARVYEHNVCFVDLVL
jgi:hypothetical protein